MEIMIFMGIYPMVLQDYLLFAIFYESLAEQFCMNFL